MHYILFHEYAPDHLERRGEFLNRHMALARASMGRRECFPGGAFADPADGAAVVIRGDSPAVSASLAKQGPYLLDGLVTSWRVREWTTVARRHAETPIVS